MQSVPKKAIEINRSQSKSTPKSKKTSTTSKLKSKRSTSQKIKTPAAQFNQGKRDLVGKTAGNRTPKKGQAMSGPRTNRSQKNKRKSKTNAAVQKTKSLVKPKKSNRATSSTPRSQLKAKKNHKSKATVKKTPKVSSRDKSRTSSRKRPKTSVDFDAKIIVPRPGTPSQDGSSVRTSVSSAEKASKGKHTKPSHVERALKSTSQQRKHIRSDCRLRPYCPVVIGSVQYQVTLLHVF